MADPSRYRLFTLSAVALCAGVAAGPHAGAVHTPLSAAAPSPKTRSTVDAAASLPVSFEANRGQTDPRVDFISRGPGYTLYLTPTEAVVTLERGRKAPGAPLDVLRMRLVGSNARPAIEGLERLPGIANYFQVRSAERRVENVPTYGRVRYRGVYAGVDLVYYGNRTALEYDFVVAPGASPHAIRLAFDGADAIEVDAAGDLVLRTPAGEVRLQKPALYQDKHGVRRHVEGSYAISEGGVGFEIGPYDSSTPLVIDPVLLYSSFLGGSQVDIGTDVALDAAGNIYITGSTSSLNFPLANPAQPAKAAGSDAFVTKLNPSGTTLLYSTYFGNNGNDAGVGIAVDGGGNAYVTGSFGVLTALSLWQSQVLVAKFSPTGTVVYAVAFGSSDDDVGYAIAIDPGGYAYVTGQTGAASDFPTTANAFQPAWNGAHDAFVSVISPDASTLVYSTYLGGGLVDEGRAIALDSAGDAYVTGGTTGGFPTTPGAYQTGLRGFGDAFIVKLKPYLSGAASVAWSTLLGGSDFDVAHSIALDASGNSYVTGSTTSSLDFPTTAGAFQTIGGGGDCGTITQPKDCQDAFVTKLNSTGSGLIYSTMLGGVGHDFGNGIALDAARNAYVTGQAFAHNFPVHNAVQSVKGGGTDAFVTKVNSTGAGLVYSTYLGGTADDGGSDLVLNGSGAVYVIGITASANFPLASPFQPTYGGNSDAFIAKIGDTTCTYSIDPTSQSFSPAAGSGSITVTAGAGCSWTTTEALSWVTVTSGTGTGNGSVNYSVAANSSTAPRSGTMTVAGQTFTVNQAGVDPPCTFSISPTSQSFGSTGGSGSIAVTASGSTCAWSTANALSWVTITAGSGTGSGNATYTVASNPSTSPRDGTFTVAGNTFTVNQAGASGGAISVTVASPNGGEKLYTGTPYRIDWTATGAITQFDVESSSNGGASYSPISGCTGLAGAARSCTWAAPVPTTTNGRIRVVARDGGGATAADASNAAFSVLTGTASIAVTFPTANKVNVGIGSLQQIKWSHNLGTEAFVRIELSRDGGVTYPEVVSPAVKNTAATTGTFAWRVTGPATVGAQARLRITWTNGPTNDVSDVNFTIAPIFVKLTTPKANSSWGFDTTQKQAWTTNLGELDIVNVQLSTAGSGGAFTTLPGGANIVATKKSANVLVPGTATTTARVAVVWANPPAGASAQGLNPGNFKLEAPFVNVTAPAAGQVWTTGTKAAISWANNLGALENVRIELSKDSGASYPVVILPNTPSDGKQSVTVQGSWGPQATTRVRITWVKSATATGQSGVFVIQP